MNNQLLNPSRCLGRQNQEAMESKAVNGRAVKGHHFDVEAAVAKLKIKKDKKQPSGEECSDDPKNTR